MSSRYRRCDHVVGAPRTFSSIGQLRGNSVHGPRLVTAVATHHALGPARPDRTSSRSRSRTRRVASGLVEERDVGDGEAVRRMRKRVEPDIDRALHRRVDDLLRDRGARGSRQTRSRRAFPVKGAGAVQDPGPKRVTRASNPDVPCATTSRASTSASIVGTPNFSNCARTWLFPVAMPPVSATRRIDSRTPQASQLSTEPESNPNS